MEEEEEEEEKQKKKQQPFFVELTVLSTKRPHSFHKSPHFKIHEEELWTH